MSKVGERFLQAGCHKLAKDKVQEKGALFPHRKLVHP
jgi:hypothetical protein